MLISIIFSINSIVYTGETLKLISFEQSFVGWTHNYRGTDGFRPPEVLDIRHDEHVSLRADIWAVGVVFFVMLHLYNPFVGKNREEVELFLRHQDFRRISYFNEEVNYFFQMCLCPLEHGRQMFFLNM